VFLVVAEEAVGRSVPFVFLERIKEDFMQRYGSSIDEEHPLADDADEDDFLFEDRFSIAYNLDREFGYGFFPYSVLWLYFGVLLPWKCLLLFSLSLLGSGQGSRITCSTVLIIQRK
jgi:hypothetical protein